MTLFERALSLGSRAKQQRDHEAREQVAGSIRSRTENLEDLLQRLESARSRVRALEEGGDRRSSWPAPPSDAFAAYDLGAASPLSLESTRRDEWTGFVVALKKFVEKVEKTVTQDIKEARRTATEGISSDDLRGYQDDPSTAQEAQQLLGTFEWLGQQRWEELQGPALLDVLQRAHALRADVVRLRETGASEELLRFLALAKEGGAPLGALNDALRSELEARKLLGRLRLILDPGLSRPPATPKPPGRS